jgi:hypothetical protein
MTTLTKARDITGITLLAAIASSSLAQSAATPEGVSFLLAISAGAWLAGFGMACGYVSLALWSMR